MEKDFEKWGREKRNLHESAESQIYYEGEVIWCAFGANIGSEMDGKGPDFMRPVLVIKGLSKQACICLPVSTVPKNDRFHRSIRLKDGQQRTVSLSQVRAIDTKRFSRVIGRIEIDELISIKKALMEVIQ